MLYRIPSDEELTAIRVIDERTAKYIPLEMVDAVKKGLDMINNPSKAGSGGVLDRVSYIDRYIVYDTSPLLTLEVLKYIIFWIKHYSWDDAYIECMSDEMAVRKVQEYKEMAVCDGAYFDAMYEDLYSVTRYVPNKSYRLLLKWLSHKTSYPYRDIILKDIDIRIRKEMFLSPEFSITTKYGRDYIYIRYYDNESGAFQGCFINVGESCLICLKQTSLMQCSRCGEAHYCCKEHQKRDWQRHKKECF